MFVLLLVALAAYTPAISWYLLSGSGTLPFLTPAEFSHMHDVQHLVFRALVLAALSVGALLLYGRYWEIVPAVFRDALIMCGGLGVLLIPFGWTFRQFHGVLFPAGNWQFPYDSWLITHYPPAFFFGAAAAWLLLSGLLLFFVLKKIKDKEKDVLRRTRR